MYCTRYSKGKSSRHLVRTDFLRCSFQTPCPLQLTCIRTPFSISVQSPKPVFPCLHLSTLPYWFMLQATDRQVHIRSVQKVQMCTPSRFTIRTRGRPMSLIIIPFPHPSIYGYCEPYCISYCTLLVHTRAQASRPAPERRAVNFWMTRGPPAFSLSSFFPLWLQGSKLFSLLGCFFLLLQKYKTVLSGPLATFPRIPSCFFSLVGGVVCFGPNSMSTPETKRSALSCHHPSDSPPPGIDRGHPPSIPLPRRRYIVRHLRRS